jgi:glycosyltransferase involved in cell wall biosynthesis
MATADVRRPIRVLHVVRPAVGGMKGHVMQIATGLDAYGYEAEIACPGDSDAIESALAAGLAVHPVPIAGPLSPFRDVEAVIVLADRIRHGAFDIVHAHGFKAGLVARVASMFAGCPNRIVTVHNHVLYRDIAAFTKWTYTAVERWLSHHTSRIIAVSDSLRDELLDAYGIDPALVVTVHNGLDLEPYTGTIDPGPVRDRYGLPREALVFGLAARFAPQKAMDVLVEAAVPVLERIPDAWLVVAGDGPLLEEVVRQASLTPVADRMLFPGFETDVRGLLGSIDVYVSAALSEGLPLATIEAMAAGLPVVSTRAGGTPEVVVDGETGLLAGPGDAQALGDAMLRMARDPVMRVAMGEAGRRRALEEFTETRMLDRTAEVYREVLCSTSPR